VPAPFPKVLGNGWLGKAATLANLASIRLSKSLFAYQIFVVAETTPDVDFILEDTRAVSSDEFVESRRAAVPCNATPARVQNGAH